MVFQARCSSDYHAGLSQEDLGTLTYVSYCRTLRVLISRLHNFSHGESSPSNFKSAGVAVSGNLGSVTKSAMWYEWKRIIEGNWNNRDLYRRFGENRDGRQITLSNPKFSLLLQVSFSIHLPHLRCYNSEKNRE